MDHQDSPTVDINTQIFSFILVSQTSHFSLGEWGWYLQCVSSLPALCLSSSILSASSKEYLYATQHLSKLSNYHYKCNVLGPPFNCVSFLLLCWSSYYIHHINNLLIINFISSLPGSLSLPSITSAHAISIHAIGIWNKFCKEKCTQRADSCCCTAETNTAW